MSASAIATPKLSLSLSHTSNVELKEIVGILIRNAWGIMHTLGSATSPWNGVGENEVLFAGAGWLR